MKIDGSNRLKLEIQKYPVTVTGIDFVVDSLGHIDGNYVAFTARGFSSTEGLVGISRFKNC